MGFELERTEALLGSEAIERLGCIRVAVFGIGGVGGHAAEALARSGVGAIDLIDGDQVSPTNINRQIIALHSTLGRPKTEVMGERLKDINPGIKLKTHQMYFSAGRAGELPFDEFDYIVDAIDDVNAKLALIVTARDRGIPIISAMGAGDKLDPMRFKAADIFETSVCPLARVMRRELRRIGISSLRVVYSDEPPVHGRDGCETEPPVHGRDGCDATSAQRRYVPGSTAFVPAAAGLLMAAEVVKDILGREQRLKNM